jgi:hypothetical protein
VLAGVDGPQENLRLPIQLDRKRWARVIIYDRSDPPLAIDGVTGEWPMEEIVFRARAAGQHMLYVGDASSTAPSYDLERVVARSGDVPIAFAEAKELGPNPRFAARKPTDKRPWTERNRLPIGIALALVLGGLALFTLRLIRRSQPPHADGE